ncbi:hypothetical protein PROFUN_14728 [Planoprotostelium fungivorum]|uniref:NEDD8-activating enzyme E1 catalytic subunit n=1 Tax=Planoprotostelium fungivorum TaxID=1890364 RepID=A0A2P6N236_9EUKA|nr:hypothetical protein PROFUN_14728 [Planoprotostelium fungivorum]
MATQVEDGKWHHLGKLLGRPGPFATEDFSANLEEHKKNLVETWKVLVIGAGGLGCELLKNLAYSGFRNIEPKAVTAATFINKRFPGVNVVPYFGRIEDKGEEYYRQFKIIIAGLDSIPARRWINSTLVNMLVYDDEGNIDPDSVIPFIDGGTEGFKGQSRVIYPGFTSCFECSLEAFPPQVNYPICTLANTPRLPEHCIEWAHILEWPKVWKETKFDADNTDHMKWMFETASKRAEEFNIKGVTYRLTQGVVKNIIPAIASTNAIIAASEVTEALKIVTNAADVLNNYMMYIGGEGIYTHTFEYEKKENCLVCGTSQSVYSVSGDIKLEEFIEMLGGDVNYQLKKPSIRCNNKNVFMQAPKALLEATTPNLSKKLNELFQSGDTLDITDPLLSSAAITLSEVNGVSQVFERLTSHRIQSHSQGKT